MPIRQTRRNKRRIAQKKSLWKMVSEMSSIWHENRRSPNVTKNVCKTIAFGWPAKTQIFTFAGKPNETISLTFWPFFDRIFFFEKWDFLIYFTPLWYNVGNEIKSFLTSSKSGQNYKMTQDESWFHIKA